MTTRRRFGPLLVLAVVALVPAVALATLWRWATGEAASSTTTTTTTTPPGPPVPELTTPLLSLRRAPGPVADAAAWAAYADLAERYMTSIDDTTCAAVSIDGRRVAGANTDLPLLPASNQKLLVAAVALDVLGPDHRFVTEVRGQPIVDGVLAGDLYLVGGGDPLLASAGVPDLSAHPPIAVTSLDALADELVAAGLTRVDGDVVGDGSRYDDEYVVPTWGPGIARVEAGPYDALLVNDGRLFGSGVGLDPNQSAASELNRLLSARGVEIAGRNRTDPAPPGLEVLASVEGADLATVVGELLRTSDDNTAEMLLKEIGVASSGVGSRSAGLEAVAATLRSWDVPLGGVVLDDGSGLSRENRITCDTLMAVLEHVGPRSPLIAGLPVAGESGTLSDELLTSPVAGRLRAKTGTLTDVKALAGAYRGDGGEQVVVTLVSNTPGADDPAVYRPRWDELGLLLDRHPVGPDSDDLGPR